MEIQSVLLKVKRYWFEFWGITFFIGVGVNFIEIICRTIFHFSVDLMYDIPTWLTIWSVMMLAGPILPDGDHVSVDMIREKLYGTSRKICEIIICLATIAFGAMISWGGITFTLQCYKFNMCIVRSVSVPRWLVESCVPIGMLLFTIFALYQFYIVIKTKYVKADQQIE